MQKTSNSSPAHRGRTGPILWLCFLAALLLLAGERTAMLESWYYDFLQRQQPAQGSDRIVILTTDQTDGSPATIWDLDRLKAVTEALNSAGADLIVLIEPPPTSNALPDVSQLSALVDLERRVRAANGDDTDNDMDSLTQQLANIRRQYERQEKITAAVASAGNVILALPTTQAAGNTPSDNPTCAKLAIKLPGDTDLANLFRHKLALPSEQLCTSARHIGFVDFETDFDGVVRHNRLMAGSAGNIYSSLAYAAAISAKDSSVASIVEASAAERLKAGKPRHFNSLTRFYSGFDQSPAFVSISINALLAGEIPPEQITGRIILVGSTENGNYATPLADNTPAITLVATELSNLLLQDSLHRPDWLTTLEPVLLLLAGCMLLIWLPLMSAAGSALASLFLMMILLTTEVYVLLTLGIWMQLVTVALFTLLGTGSLHIIRGMLSPADKQPSSASPVPSGSGRMSEEDEIDLEFSVLRQQEDSEDTKHRLYKIAMTHGRRKEFAKAERVFQHLESLDPEYRDVAEKLRKLSGASNKNATGQETGNAESAVENISPERKPEQEKSDITDGKRLGRYELIEKIGQGAMASVYLGRDPKINRKVAIKTIALAEEFSQEDLEATKEQFLREAESAGRLNHPNIIAIYDVGEDNDVAYLAMEYFEGVALNQHAVTGSLLPAKWVLELTARAAEALHYAHGQNVVHRDIKPANVMYHAGKDELKIADFGIARLTDTSRTKTGIILGTPSYMSPEQLSASAVTGQSDLYSLGITMYQLLCGQVPFQADSIPRLMDKIANQPPPPVTQQRQELPSCIDAILDRVLAKAPEDRFANGRAMALALRDCVESFTD